ncbi:MAG: tRNA (adenosine(37)-N6)-dimethylallyltransferase MiaA [Bacteroidales bacterium]
MKKYLHTITGPTASGKSDLAIELAEELGVPILSFDSRQIYRELKIGTAPPSPQYLKRVEHHFIHSHSIYQNYSAGQYEAEALPVVERLFQKYNHLVAVGGSGLYCRALCCGIDWFPPADYKIREELSSLHKIEGIEPLQKRLKEVDRESWEKIDLNNPQRVIRALEVTLSTGRKFSSYKSGERGGRSFEIKRINLNPNREELYSRIDARVERMMEEGLLEEASSLFKERHLTALKSVGYSELFQYLEGKITLDRAVELIKRNSRRYAKRQITWFKKGC